MGFCNQSTIDFQGRHCLGSDLIPGRRAHSFDCEYAATNAIPAACPLPVTPVQMGVYSVPGSNSSSDIMGPQVCMLSNILMLSHIESEHLQHLLTVCLSHLPLIPVIIFYHREIVDLCAVLGFCCYLFGSVLHFLAKLLFF